MRTTCPTCDTAYTVPDERIGAKGRKVRCTKCGDEWRVLPVVDEKPLPAPPRPAPPPVASPPPLEATAHGENDPFADPFTDPFAEDGTAHHDDPFEDTDEGPSDHRLDDHHEVEAAEPVAPALAAPPRMPRGRRVQIHVRRHLPRIGRKTLAAFTTGAAPFVGPLIFLLACAVLTGVYALRQSVVAAAPDLAGLYSALGAPVNLRGLDFGRIETLREIDNGQPVLVVEGSITNVTKQLREVPALRFALRGPDTQELYAWSIDPKSTTIESGDTIRFRTRLAAPPDQATEVQVRFVERRSQHAGLP